MKKLILDANMVCKVLGNKDPSVSDLSDALLMGYRFKVAAVRGGQLSDEYMRIIKYRSLYLELERAGRMILADDNNVRLDTDHVAKISFLQSDDTHILALARVAGVRILCSHDTNLHADFTNQNIVPPPLGRVWQNNSHSHLLQ